MFKFNNLKRLHLEISNSCQASCPMCARNIHGGQENPLLKISNWTFDEFKTIVSPEVLAQVDGYYFCGNFGEPILNNDLIKMCKWSSEIAPNVHIAIHTNGSARNVNWWKTLATSLPSSHRVVFALDGLADTHHIHRIGTKFNTILKNAKAFIEAGGIAEWTFIKFKHNEHQVTDAKELASNLGFKYFTVKNSTRFVLDTKFDVRDKSGNFRYFIEPPTTNQMTFIDKNVIDNYKEVVNNSEINCYAIKHNEVFIDAHKNLFPCCFLASVPYTYIQSTDYARSIREEIVSQYYDLEKDLGGLENLNTINRSVKDIINSKEYQTVWDEYWTTKKLIICARTCGQLKEKNLSKPADQQIEGSKLDI
jgi:MoaA/NifB/PqqE/SkfB family radical SAM enzyme